jgi:hypothetical protein
MSESDTIIVLNMEYMNEDPKESKPRVVEETEHEHNFEEEFEDLPSEGDEIEDIFVYQNNTSRFLKHYF